MSKMQTNNQSTQQISNEASTSTIVYFLILILKLIINNTEKRPQVFGLWTRKSKNALWRFGLSWM